MHKALTGLGINLDSNNTEYQAYAVTNTTFDAMIKAVSPLPGNGKTMALLLV